MEGNMGRPVYTYTPDEQKLLHAAHKVTEHALSLVQSHRLLGRKRIEVRIQLGKALITVHDRLKPSGLFSKFLCIEGIPRVAAYRWMSHADPKRFVNGSGLYRTKLWKVNALLRAIKNARSAKEEQRAYAAVCRYIKQAYMVRN
jgi:hypothetical protein